MNGVSIDHSEPRLFLVIPSKYLNLNFYMEAFVEMSLYKKKQNLFQWTV